jgi:hypothetical protein
MNKTPLMSEMTVNNKLKLGICFKKAAQIIFFCQSWFDPPIIYRYPEYNSSNIVFDLNTFKFL